MHDRPSAAELCDAVRGFLEDEVVKTIEDPRLRFRTLVAINALGIAERDLTRGEELARQEAALLRELLGAQPSGAPSRDEARALSAELCRRIRAGSAPPGTLAALRRIAEFKLEVASPKYRGRAINPSVRLC
jgi:Domain of unknown function (DUF6285)